MVTKITLSVSDSEALHFERLTKSLGMKKNELFRKALDLYEDYLLVNELEVRSKNGQNKKYSYEELEKFINAN